MSEPSRLLATIERFPKGAMFAYLGLVLLLGAVTWGLIADIFDRHADLAAAREILDQLEGRRSLARNVQAATNAVPSGSPLLEGPTVTVAGASLLQRVAGAVTKIGGNVLSSQVELRGAQSKVGFITVITSCELDQSSLQKLLYDLEAGMPFLFVDQLVVQAPSTTSPEGRIRILLAVSAQWQDAR